MNENDKINNMQKPVYTKVDQIIEHVKSDHKMLKSYISGGIDNNHRLMIVYLTGKNAFKQPNWFNENTFTYDAQKLKDKILTTFEKNPGQYGYGILLGLQPSGYYIVCIDIDIDNDCKYAVLKQFEEIFKSRNIYYYTEPTKSGRYHIYAALDKLTDELKKINKIAVSEECVKYKYGKELPGEVELLGVEDKPHTITVYNGIINDEKPFFVEQLHVNKAEDFLEALKEFINIYEETYDIEETEETQDTKRPKKLDTNGIDKLVEFYKLVWKHRFVNGWEIDKVVSAVCVTSGFEDHVIYRIFEEIYGDDFDEKQTIYIIEHTKEKDPQYLPSVARVIVHAKEFVKDSRFTDDEKKVAKNLIHSISDFGFELPDYLINAEKVYFVASYEKQSKDKVTNRPIYRERWFIERNVNNVKQVWHVEIETSYPKDIYQQHRAITYPKQVSLKTDIKRLLKEQTEVYEVIINDEFTFVPSFSFDRLEDIAIEIAKRCSGYKARFDIPLFQEYLDIKIMEYLNKHGGKPTPCYISKSTGWSDDFKMFFHYDLNDEKHELSKDNPLYKYRKAESKNQKEQHEFVLKLLKEGKLLGVLLSISASSILLKPLNLQPLTCILAGNPGAGKTTASLIATSLFYKSDTILLNANATNVGIELTLSDLKSMPFVIDEGALADVGISLKHTIFSVASGKGRTRGRKDLSVDTKDIVSNVFWTTETTDVDEIKRGGAYRRMLYITVEEWKDFTQEVELSSKEPRPNEKFAGCGVDYIRFAVENLDKLSEIFIQETRDFSVRYGEITGLAENIYAGIVFLEQYYNQKFDQLRQTVDELLREAKKTFVLTRDNIVEMLQQYLYNNLHRLGHVVQVRDGEGGYKYETKYKPSSKEMLGEYDETTQTYYISTTGFKTIAKELEKERNLLVNALVKAGVIEKRTENVKGKEKEETTMPYYSKITKDKIRVYKLKFPDLPDQPPSDASDNTPPSDNPPDSPNTPELVPTEPMSNDYKQTGQSDMETNDTTDYDTLDVAVEGFTTSSTVKAFDRKQTSSVLQPIDTKQIDAQPFDTTLSDTEAVVEQPFDTESSDAYCGDTEIVESSNNAPEQSEQTIDEIGDADINFEESDNESTDGGNKNMSKEEIETTKQSDTNNKENKPKNKIIIDEDTIDINNVKPREEIPTYQIPKKNIKPFSKLTIGSFDIETTGLKETDQILAIAFNVYENGELIDKKRFYVDEYDNDDAKMVSAFLDKLKESNINVLTGWNIYDFDLQRIKAKDKNNKLRFTDPPVNIAGTRLNSNNNEPLKGYCIYVGDKYIEVIDAMHLTIKYDNVARDIPAQSYQLKAVAKHFGISDESRVVLGADQILKAYEERNIELLEKYHGEDVREAYEIFKKLATSYYYIRSIVPFDISFFDAYRLSTAALWEKILEQAYNFEYKNTISADEKAWFEGGLVVANKGLYKDVYKIDVASLYPNIMLNYYVYSRKDTKKVALAVLNEYTNLRLQLKKQAKLGNVEADLIQSALKVLINSLFGFYGTGGYLFNDMKAAATITAFGRKILRYMINYIETRKGIIIECDTDGIFYSAVNGEEIYEGLKQEMNKINFDIELEHRNCVMFASDKKNYVLIEEGNKVKKKGSKYAGRDKNRLWTEFVVEYIKRYIEDKKKAEEYEKEMWNRIFRREAFDWLKITRKVSKSDKSIIEAAKSKGKDISHGSIVTYVYSDFRGKRYIFEGENESLYDVNYYLSEFKKLMKEIKDVINATATNTNTNYK